MPDNQNYREFKTPSYLYNLSILRNTITMMLKASSYPGFKIHYAVKANFNPVILQTISQMGIGADTVSGGEIRQALNNGFNGHDIVFAGVGKTDSEIIYALENGVGCFNVESLVELECINEIAASKKLIAPIALRVNPNIDAHTHHYITTGLEENKFGIDINTLDKAIARCHNLANINLIGLHFHIGSQITDLQPYILLCDSINKIQQQYSDINFKTINVGGGLGIDYDNPIENPIPDFKSYFNVFHKHLNLKPGQELHFELGRSIVGQCGILLSKVTYVKNGSHKKFIILDAGMTELIRPALYQAHHAIYNLTSTSDKTDTYDVVGPICESSDTFANNLIMPKTKRGDVIGIYSAGAYGESMASRYNCRDLPESYFCQ